MSAQKGGRECQKGVIPTRRPRAQRSGLYAALVAGLFGYLSNQAAAQAPTMRQAAPQAEAARPDSSGVQTDRLRILQQERARTLEQVEKFKAGADPLALQRAVADLQALDREIATVTRESPYAIKTQKPAGNPAAQPSAVAQATTPPQQNDLVYESWDVFKNFGKKGN